VDFYDNTVSLEGRTNKTATMLVEFWWWLHRKEDYVMRIDHDKRKCFTKIRGKI
jgi:hypothetical protein